MDVTVYLDIDGVLVTKFSDGTQFDGVCVTVLQQFLARCQHSFQSVHLVLISDWRFEQPPEALRSLFAQHELLTHVNVFRIPIQIQHREQQILHSLNSTPFIILDDASYTEAALQPHLVQLRTEDGLRAVEDVAYLLRMIK